MASHDNSADNWNVQKSAEQRARIRARKATRNSVKNRPVRVNRSGNAFQNVTVTMTEDIPTAGDGWTFNPAS